MQLLVTANQSVKAGQQTGKTNWKTKLEQNPGKKLEKYRGGKFPGKFEKKLKTG